MKSLSHVRLQARVLEWGAIAFSDWRLTILKSQSEVVQSCPTLHDPMDCSLPGSSVHGIFQARVLEWGAIAFSDGTQPSSPQIHYPLLTLIPFVCVEGGALV